MLVGANRMWGGDGDGGGGDGGGLGGSVGAGGASGGEHTLQVTGHRSLTPGPYAPSVQYTSSCPQVAASSLIK